MASTTVIQKASIRPGSRVSAPLAATVAAVAVCAPAVVLVATTTPADARFERTLLEALVVGVPAATGLYAIRSKRTVRFGVGLLAVALVWSLTALGESDASVPYSIARVSAWLIFPILAYLILAFPDGRVAAGADRRLLSSIAGLVLVLFVGSALAVEAYPVLTPWASCRGDCPHNAFLVLDHEPAIMASLVAPLREALGVVLFAGVTYSTLRRWRAGSALRRRVLSPLLAASVFSTVSLAAFVLVRRAAPDSAAADPLGDIWSLTVPLIAAAFLLGLTRRRAMVALVLTRLTVALSHRLDRRELRDALAFALDDPSVDILVPEDTPGRWRTSDGRTTSRQAAAGAGQVVTTIEDDGGEVAALVHDAVLLDDDELLASVHALVLTTLRHTWMTERLAASLGQLEASRARIARAADLERSRIERDLHDGAQQRLIGLRIKLSLAEELSIQDPSAGPEAMRSLGVEVERALDELRALAHGVYPSVLADRGLADALSSVLAQMPLRVHFSAGRLTRHPAEVENAIYFTCVEAAQNAIKHAGGATCLWVTLRQDRALRFEVRDDGQGFESPTGDFNGGLRNMRDRIEAVHGRLTIDSTPGHGTRIRGRVPVR